jgi:hypothetical protein
MVSQNGNQEMLRMMIEVGGVEMAVMTTNDGVSCVHIASAYGHIEALEILIKAGGKELVMRQVVIGDPLSTSMLQLPDGQATFVLQKKIKKSPGTTFPAR